MISFSHLETFCSWTENLSEIVLRITTSTSILAFDSAILYQDICTVLFFCLTEEGLKNYCWVITLFLKQRSIKVWNHRTLLINGQSFPPIAKKTIFVIIYLAICRNIFKIQFSIWYEEKVWVFMFCSCIFLLNSFILYRYLKAVNK